MKLSLMYCITTLLVANTLLMMLLYTAYCIKGNNSAADSNVRIYILANEACKSKG